MFELKFALSYSFGKDSTLALHKMIEQGHTPVALIVMVNEKEKRSFFHGVDYDMMARISKCLGIPFLLGKSIGSDYNHVMEKQLKKAKDLGAKICVFGDIDIEEHREWDTERCEKVGLEPHFPLWKKDREEVVNELISLNYKCVIKAIHNQKLPKSVLGKTLNHKILDVFGEHNIDICGEFGEYHTIVVDGPIFKSKLDYVIREPLDFGITSIVNMF